MLERLCTKTLKISQTKLLATHSFSLFGVKGRVYRTRALCFFLILYLQSDDQHDLKSTVQYIFYNKKYYLTTVRKFWNLDMTKAFDLNQVKFILLFYQKRKVIFPKFLLLFALQQEYFLLIVIIINIMNTEIGCCLLNLRGGKNLVGDQFDETLSQTWLTGANFFALALSPLNTFHAQQDCANLKILQGGSIFILARGLP